MNIGWNKHTHDVTIYLNLSLYWSAHIYSLLLKTISPIFLRIQKNMKRYFTILSIAALLTSLFTTIHAERHSALRQMRTECLTPEGISSLLGFSLYNVNRCHIVVNMCDYVKCANDAICRSTNTSRCFECVCQPGFTGTMCQQRENVTDISKMFVNFFLT